ncbi:hypothetical protein NL676_030358 [Syzygium grande]|nr:hypothetical protein NL676_030358 [Syzygium grande]
MDIAVERRRRWRSPEQPVARSFPLPPRPSLSNRKNLVLARRYIPPSSVSEPLLRLQALFFILSLSRRETQKPASSFPPTFSPLPLPKKPKRPFDG